MNQYWVNQYKHICGVIVGLSIVKSQYASLPLLLGTNSTTVLFGLPGLYW